MPHKTSPLNGYQELITRQLTVAHNWWMSDTPVTSNAFINMVVTFTPNSPANCTCSKILTPTDTTPHADVKSILNNDNVNAPPPLMEDCKDTLQLIQKTASFCKCISKWLFNGKAPSYEADTFTHIKGLLYKHVKDSNQKFLALVTPIPSISQYLLKLNNISTNMVLNEVTTFFTSS